MKKRISGVEFDSASELFSTTYATFDVIRQRCEQNDGYVTGFAIELYIFYCKQSAIQETQTTFSNNNFVAKGLGRSVNKVSKYRKCLKDIGVIETVVKKDEEGKIIGKYVKVQYVAKVNHHVGYLYDGLTYTMNQARPNTDKYKYINTDKTKNKYFEQVEEVKKLNYNFEDYRNEYPNKKGKKKAKDLFSRKIKSDAKFQELMQGLKGYKDEHERMESRGEFVPQRQQGDTFLSKETRLDYLEDNIQVDPREDFLAWCYPNNSFIINKKGKERFLEKYPEELYKQYREKQDKILLSQSTQYAT